MFRKMILQLCLSQAQSQLQAMMDKAAPDSETHRVCRDLIVAIKGAQAALASAS